MTRLQLEFQKEPKGSFFVSLFTLVKIMKVAYETILF